MATALRHPFICSIPLGDVASSDQGHGRSVSKLRRRSSPIGRHLDRCSNRMGGHPLGVAEALAHGGSRPSGQLAAWDRSVPSVSAPDRLAFCPLRLRSLARREGSRPP
jgi:hypothetical protein